MNIRKRQQAFIVQTICFLLIITTARSQGNCEASTLDQFFECYGGKSAFSAHSVIALTTFVQAEDAIKAGQYAQAKALIDKLYAQYPVGDNVWSQVWNAPNGANVGTPHAYYGLRMMEDIIAYNLNPLSPTTVKKANMNVVLVGCSKGIQPTTKAELQNGTGVFVTHSLDPKIKENDYRIVRQSMDLFSKYLTAITNGAVELHIGFIELDTLCLPVKVSTTKPYNASGDYGLVLNALSKAARDTTDMFLISYPSHVPDSPVFDDESFITGGMGSDSKGGPVFIADDKWVVRKPAHLGKGLYTDIERRVYLPQWLQHEFFHHVFRIYPEYNLEVKGHDWFDRSFWPADFVGQYETDYYSESLHKRVQHDCTPLAKKLITRTGDKKPEYNLLSMDELVGAYSLDVIQNTWHEGNIILQNGKYYWRNKANVQWQLTPSFTDGTLKTGGDCPYPGQDFLLQLYETVEGDNYPGVVSFKFGGEFYKKRFGLMRQSIPIELCLGSYKRVPNEQTQHEGSLTKSQGEIVWKNSAGESWLLNPNAIDECLLHTKNSPTPNERFQLILVNADCGVYALGFKYLDYYYWKPKRLLSDESPTVTGSIRDMELQKGFGRHNVSLGDVFKDSKGDSLHLFVTSKDTAIIKATIDKHTLQLIENGEGATTLYVMALDKNGGLAVDEFTARVNSTSSGIDEQDSLTAITVSQTLSDDIVNVSGIPNNCRIKIVSLEGCEEDVPLSGNATSINISHLSSGMYLLVCTETRTGVSQWRRIVKY